MRKLLVLGLFMVMALIQSVAFAADVPEVIYGGGWTAKYPPGTVIPKVVCDVDYKLVTFTSTRIEIAIIDSEMEEMVLIAADKGGTCEMGHQWFKGDKEGMQATLKRAMTDDATGKQIIPVAHPSGMKVYRTALNPQVVKSGSWMTSDQVWYTVEYPVIGLKIVTTNSNTTNGIWPYEYRW